MLAFFAAAPQAGAEAPAFPQFPEAKGKVNIQSFLSLSGDGYCQEAAAAKDKQPLAEEARKILQRELELASRICKGSKFVKFPGVPKDANLQQIADFMFLEQGLFALYVALRDVDGAIMVHMHMKNLKVADSFLWSDLGKAYPDEPLLEQMNQVSSWMRLARQE